MFNLGFSELIIIIIAVILFIKPSEIPLLFKRVRGYYKNFLKFKNSLKEEIKDDWDL